MTAPSPARWQHLAAPQATRAPFPIRCASAIRWSRPFATAKTRTRPRPSTRDGSGTGVAGAQQLQGKELSYNNLVDLDACWDLAQEFTEPAVAIIKHTNPCGAATGTSTARGLHQGALNRPCLCLRRRHRRKPRDRRSCGRGDRETLRRGHRRARLLRRERWPALPPRRTCGWWWSNRLHAPGSSNRSPAACCCRMPIPGRSRRDELRTVTRRPPTAEELANLLFAWKVAKHVKSNAIVYARGGQTIGVGAGQMSRVDAARFGAMKADSAPRRHGGCLRCLLPLPGRPGDHRRRLARPL